MHLYRHYAGDDFFNDVTWYSLQHVNTSSILYGAESMVLLTVTARENLTNFL